MQSTRREKNVSGAVDTIFRTFSVCFSWSKLMSVCVCVCFRILVGSLIQMSSLQWRWHFSNRFFFGIFAFVSRFVRYKREFVANVFNSNSCNSIPAIWSLEFDLITSLENWKIQRRKTCKCMDFFFINLQQN